MVFKNIAKNIIYGTLDVFTKLAFPSNKRIFLNINFNTEWIASKRIFTELLEFTKWFYKETGKKSTLCITTPYSPQTKKQMGKFVVDEKEYKKRVKTLAEFSYIGYHGHFFHILDPKKDDEKLFEELYKFGDSGISEIWRPNLVPINSNNYSFEVVKKQMDSEISWLKENIKKPDIYTAGFWFLTKDIVLELERHGFKIDFSIRKLYKDTFGKRYLDFNTIPNLGEMFILSPSQGIIEIQSAFYLSTHRYKLKKALLEQFFNNNFPIYIILPLHDTDLINCKSHIWKNMKFLSKFKEVFNWMDIYDMREAFLSNRGLG